MQTYKLAEKAVLEYFNSSKDCYAARFTDTHDINSQLRRFRIIGSPMVYAHRNPSDFIVVERGETYFAEAKSTENIKGVSSSLFDEQKGERTRILRAGGKYFYFVYSFVRARWYKIPGAVIAEKATRTWEELAPYTVRYLKGL